MKKILVKKIKYFKQKVTIKSFKDSRTIRFVSRVNP